MQLWDCVASNFGTVHKYPFGASIVESNNSTLCIFFTVASPSVCVTACYGGCWRMLWTSCLGLLFLFEEGLTKSLSSLLESMSIFIRYVAFFLAAPSVCKCQNFAIVSNVLYIVIVNLRCPYVFIDPGWCVRCGAHTQLVVFPSGTPSLQSAYVLVKMTYNCYVQKIELL
jgi:hypothetical protein